MIVRLYSPHHLHAKGPSVQLKQYRLWVVPRPEICWFETLVGRTYLARNVIGSNRVGFWLRQDTPCKDRHCPLDTPGVLDV